MNAISWFTTLGLWWLVSFLLIVTSQSMPGVHDVPLLEPAQGSQFAEATAWHSPLTVFWPSQSGRRATVWTASALAAAVIVVATSSLRTANTPLLAGLVLICLSLSADVSHVLAAASIAAVAASAMTYLQSAGNQSLKHLVISMAVVVLITIDFGLGLCVAVPVIILKQSLVWRHLKNQRTSGFSRVRPLACVTGVFLGLVIPVFLLPGFASALMRPWTSISATHAADILPSLASPFVGDLAVHHIVTVALLTFLIVFHISQKCRSSIVSIPMGLYAGMLLLIGCSTRHYFWISMVTLAACFTPCAKPKREADFAGQSRVAIPVVGGIAGIYIWLNVMISGHTTVDWVVPQRSLITDELQIPGPILLMNLDHSSDWAWRIPGDSTLLGTDRWDVFGERLFKYCEACRDIGAGKKEMYRHADGRWGGYRTFLSQFQPSAIVVDSGDLLVLRHLSLDPDWGMIAIDARRTVFRRLDNPQARMQSGRAMSFFYWLEWPTDLAPSSPEGVLQLGTDADNRVLASIMNAIRLPYAALRLLPEDDCHSTVLIKTQAYFELALRSQRQMAQFSLVDHFRAAIGGQRLETLWQLSTRQKLLRNKLSQSMVVFHNATRDAIIKLPGKNSDHPGKTQAEAKNDSDSENAEDHLEKQIRSAVLSGNVVDAQNRLSQLQHGPVRDFYEAVVSLDIDPGSGFRNLESLVLSGELPEMLQSESRFYLGCLAIEAREPSKACQHFSTCQAAASGARFTGLCDMYLFRLGCR